MLTARDQRAVRAASEAELTAEFTGGYSRAVERFKDSRVQVSFFELHQGDASAMSSSANESFSAIIARHRKRWASGGALAAAASLPVLSLVSRGLTATQLTILQLLIVDRVFRASMSQTTVDHVEALKVPHLARGTSWAQIVCAHLEQDKPVRTPACSEFGPLHGYCFNAIIRSVEDDPDALECPATQASLAALFRGTESALSPEQMRHRFCGFKPLTTVGGLARRRLKMWIAFLNGDVGTLMPLLFSAQVTSRAVMYGEPGVRVSMTDREFTAVFGGLTLERLVGVYEGAGNRLFTAVGYPRSLTPVEWVDGLYVKCSLGLDGASYACEIEATVLYYVFGGKYHSMIIRQLRELMVVKRVAAILADPSQWDRHQATRRAVAAL